MKLWLVRHGRPDIDDQLPIRGSDFKPWVDAYDAAPLDASVQPSDELRGLAASAGCIVTSTLRRSLESAALLGAATPTLSDAAFREAEIPGALLGGRWGPHHWAKLFRIAWYFGYSPGVESFSAARARARVAAAQLDQLASQHTSVMLVAHGMINGYVAWALRSRGWRGPSAFGGDYWAHYEFDKPG